MSAVLGAIALLTLALAPAVVRQLDRIASDQETAALKSFGAALQQSIQRNRSIPSHTNWVTTVALELGVETSNVTTNARKQPRFFLIDPAWRIGNNVAGESYTQTSAGSVNQPASPRVMLVSSIGRPLPDSISSGVASSDNFDALWNWNDRNNALPATSYSWTGWPNADDLKVQRVNLSSLFVRLLLSTNDSTTDGFYSVDSTNAPAQVTGTGTNGYFLQNSVLYLYNGLNDGRTNLECRRILIRDSSFVYDQDTWRDSIGGRSGGPSAPAGLDFGAIVDQYLQAPENTNAQNYTPRTGTNQQWIVVSNMIAYLDAYNRWAVLNVKQPGSWVHDATYNAAVAAQASLIDAVQRQYTKVGSSDYTPTPYTDQRCQ